MIFLKYTFKCPACEHVVEVEADNDDDAIAKINVAGAVHQKEVHPDMPAMNEEEMIKMVRGSMKKGEA